MSKTETKTKASPRPVDALVMPAKILMCGDILVDERMLEAGIYATSRPSIYYDALTIEGLISRAKEVNDSSGRTFFTQEYFDNLQKCQLVDVDIKIKA